MPVYAGTISYSLTNIGNRLNCMEMWFTNDESKKSVLTILKDGVDSCQLSFSRASLAASPPAELTAVNAASSGTNTKVEFQIPDSEVFSDAILRFTPTIFLRQIVPCPGLDLLHARSGISQWQMIGLTVSGREFSASKNRARPQTLCNIRSRIGQALHATPSGSWFWRKSLSKIIFAIPSAFQTSPMPPASIFAPCNACFANTAAPLQFRSC
jgi:hypothetical protein